MDLEGLLNDLIEVVQTIAPEIWEIAMRQALVNGIGALVWGLLFLVGAIVFFLLMRKVIIRRRVKRADYFERHHWPPETNRVPNDYTENEEIMAWLGGLAGTASLFISIIFFSDAIRFFINPGYYAIEALLDLAQ